MSITIIPKRTSADANSAADINALMANDEYLQTMIGGGKPDWVADFYPGSMVKPDTDPADVHVFALDIVPIEVAGFDSATVESLSDSFSVPDDVDPDGEFEAVIKGFPDESGGGPRYVRIRMTWQKLSSGENIWGDVSGTIESADVDLAGGESTVFIPISDTIENLGWIAGDLIAVKIEVIPPTGEGHTQLSPDFDMVMIHAHCGRE